jgi:hypothetical protein
MRPNKKVLEQERMAQPKHLDQESDKTQNIKELISWSNAGLTPSLFL